MRKELTPEQIAEVWMATSHITHVTQRHLAFARGVVEADRALGRESGPGTDHSGDLSMLVKRLVGALRRAAPGHRLADQAMDYLLRKGLSGTPLRVVSNSSETKPENCDVGNCVLAAPAAPGSHAKRSE